MGSVARSARYCTAHRQVNNRTKLAREEDQMTVTIKLSICCKQAMSIPTSKVGEWDGYCARHRPSQIEADEKFLRDHFQIVEIN